MERLSILFIFLLTIFFQETQSRDFLWSRIRIDCGASKFAVPYEGWQLDNEYINTGQNKNVSISISTPLEMSTLRSFPKGDMNCYKFSLYSPNKYLLRAGFYYGNYDGLSKPPIFDLTINGKNWTTIYTGSPNDGVQYVEVLYQTNKSRHELCLVRLGDDVPFISSIEALELPDNFYRLMTNDSVLYLQSRISFGGEGDVGQESSTIESDFYNRIWKLQKMPDDYENLTSFRTPFGTAENEPPNLILGNAITPKNNSNSNNSISISIPIPLSPSPAAYFVLYFKEPLESYRFSTHIRKIKIYVDGHEMGVTQVPENYTSQVVSLYPVAVNGPTVNVTLVEAEGSTFPPIINAMEVFASKEVSNGGYSHYCSHVLVAIFQIIGSVMLIG